MLTISGTLIAHSRTNAKRASSQSGSAMMLMATLSPMDRATSSALLLTCGVVRLRNAFRPSSSRASRPEEHVVQPEPRQRRNTSSLRSSTSHRVSR